MKLNLVAVLFLGSCLLINYGCSKSSDGTTANNTGNTSTDPATLLQNKWLVVKDSIVVHNFAFPDGTIPIPGVYYGTSNDYWLFQANGTVYIYEGGYVGTPAYQLLSGTSLLIPAMQWGDITILTLNSSSFIWEKVMTSGTSGTYYRRAYFRK